MKALLYCTKAKPYLYKTHFVKVEDVVKGINDKLIYETDNYERFYLSGEKRQALNGFIVAECEIEKVDKWVWNGWWNCYAKNDEIDIQNIDDRYWEKSCLNFGYLYDYLFCSDCYALHLSNVKVFDDPKELSEYWKDNFLQELNEIDTRIYKAPQNMMKCYDNKATPYILISIKPEWICKILNGEKTIEVRKQILNCLKEMVIDDK